MRGLSLGDVMRPYEHPDFQYLNSHRDNYVPKPLHRHDDHIAYMRPDTNGKLEVLADCQRHYARVPQRAVLDGELVPCGRCV